MKKTGEPVADPSDPAAVKAAVAVLDNHIAALNARDEAALVATLHFPRYRSDHSAIGSFRSLWIVSRLNGRWAAQARSSFAV